jgi:hypothetical protein
VTVISGEKWRGFGLFREVDDAGKRVGQAPSELALNSAGFTPLAFANAVWIGAGSPVYVAGLLRHEPRIAPWSIDTTPSRSDTEPCASMRE